MGRAGSHYTRTVQGVHPVSELDRPDPGVVFDTLLKRDKVSVETFHPDVR